MKPIKRGMTEAVTRDGRKVTQLTWFDLDSGYCIAGVIDGDVYFWPENGLWSNSQHVNDIFAPVEYEWQWLAKRPSGFFATTKFFRTEEAAQNFCEDGELIYRIEESKREVKNV